MTPKERAAMQQALEALENAYENGFLTGIAGLKTIHIITAVREALAVSEQRTEEQAEQEPVATVVDESEEQTNTMSWILSLPLPVGTKLYAAPVRTKDLTDDEIDAFIDRSWDKQMSMPEIIRAVIAAYKEKNRG